MSKAAIAIEKMITDKEKQLHDHIRNNKEAMTTFAVLKNELADLKQKRFDIAQNRISNLLEDQRKDVVAINHQTKNFPE